MTRSIEHRIAALEAKLGVSSNPEDWPEQLPGEDAQAHLLRILRSGVKLEQLVAASNSLPEETYSSPLHVHDFQRGTAEPKG